MGIVFLVAVGTMMGCDRSEPPPPPKTSAPAAAPQTAQPQAPAPAPSATPAPVPAQTQQGQLPGTSSQAMPVQPQQTAPAAPSPQPAPVPAPSQSTVQENISQVQIGMSSQQVLELLGNPTKMKQKHQEVEWEYYTPQGKYEVEFQMDKVVKIERH